MGRLALQKLDRDDITIVILLIGEASGVFAGFCPSWFTVSSPFFHEQDAFAGNVRRIREGEIAATAIVLATGAAVAFGSDRPRPVAMVASVAISAIFIGGYERAIRKPSKHESDADAGITPALTSAGFRFG
jgi:hypothetical protein